MDEPKIVSDFRMAFFDAEERVRKAATALEAICDLLMGEPEPSSATLLRAGSMLGRLQVSLSNPLLPDYWHLVDRLTETLLEGKKLPTAKVAP